MKQVIPLPAKDGKPAQQCEADGPDPTGDPEILKKFEAFKTGDEAEIDMTSNTLTRLADGAVFPLKPIGAVAPVIAAGGMFAYAREIGMIKK